MTHTALSVASPGITGWAQTPSTSPQPTSTAAMRPKDGRQGTAHLPDVTKARMAQRQEEPRAEVTRKSGEIEDPTRPPELSPVRQKDLRRLAHDAGVKTLNLDWRAPVSGGRSSLWMQTALRAVRRCERAQMRSNPEPESPRWAG